MISDKSPAPLASTPPFMRFGVPHFSGTVCRTRLRGEVLTAFATSDVTPRRFRIKGNAPELLLRLLDCPCCVHRNFVAFSNCSPGPGFQDFISGLASFDCGHEVWTQMCHGRGWYASTANSTNHKKQKKRDFILKLILNWRFWDRSWGWAVAKGGKRGGEEGKRKRRAAPPNVASLDGAHCQRYG